MSTDAASVALGLLYSQIEPLLRGYPEPLCACVVVIMPLGESLMEKSKLRHGVQRKCRCVSMVNKMAKCCPVAPFERPIHLLFWRAFLLLAIHLD
jgi:hypothetical protein